MKFIRKNGRIIPIGDDAKAPSRKKMADNYKKHGDGANQSSRIEDKYAKKENKGVTKFGATSAVAATGAVLTKGKTRFALGAIAVVSAIAGHLKKKDNVKKNESKKETDYYKTFGVGSSGEKVKKKKK